MITLLCFGDSNTWGLNPATRERYPLDIRWPGVLHNKLGEGYRVIEEGLSGRTALGANLCDDFNDSKADLVTTLSNHGPIDLVILMLGTNDLIKSDSVSAYDVGKGIDDLLGKIRHSGAGPGGSAPTVLLLAPPPFGILTGETEDLEGMVTQSHLFAERYASIAADFDCAFLNTGEVIRSSDIDGFHLDASEHKKLGLTIAKRVRSLFAAAG
ncbi:MAG TPA: GDSL-type esterase/lipase family protein [Anaerolineales bacterium]|nr:GDSL-type esterase/lipase family protein [Anaerolineales bacterium]